MTDIANRVGLIYKIVCNDLSIKDTYVGSCQAFRARKNSHKNSCSNSNNNNYNFNVYKFIRANGGWNNWSMLQIETVMFREKRELLTKERYWLETLGATLNKTIPSRTYKESNQAHYEANKEQINEKHKQYRETNKQQLAEKAKQLITCDCTRTIRKSDIIKHKNSKIHKQYQQIYNFIYS